MKTGITKVTFRRAGKKGGVLGYATIGITVGDGELLMRNFQVCKTREGELFVSWPSVKLENPKDPDKPYKPFMNTIAYEDQEFRDAFNESILEKWTKFDAEAPKANYGSGKGGGNYNKSGGKSNYGKSNYSNSNKGKSYSSSASSLDDSTF